MININSLPASNKIIIIRIFQFISVLYFTYYVFIDNKTNHTGLNYFFYVPICFLIFIYDLYKTRSYTSIMHLFIAIYVYSIFVFSIMLPYDIWAQHYMPGQGTFIGFYPFVESPLGRD